MVMYAGQGRRGRRRSSELFARPAAPLHAGPARARSRASTRPRSERLRADRGHGAAACSTCPPGCRFAPRCPYAIERCASDARRSRTSATGHAACCMLDASRRELHVTRRARLPSAAHGTRRAAAARSATSSSTSRSRGGLLRARRSAACTRSTACRFDIARGETLGLVGESGCGKSTTGALHPAPASSRPAGEVWFEGTDVTALDAARAARAAPRDADHLPGPVRVAQPAHDGRRDHRRAAGRSTAGASRARARRRASPSCSRRSGLDPTTCSRYPHEFSGGQRQRIGIARALARAARSSIVCDEPVSALDVSIQAQIINLLEDLQQRVRPDLPVHRPRPRRWCEHISDRVAVMYLGRIVELAPTRRALRATRCTPTPRRCSRRCRSPTRSVKRRAHHARRATCPARSTRRRLPLPHALPDRAAAAVHDRRAASSSRAAEGTGWPATCAAEASWARGLSAAMRSTDASLKSYYAARAREYEQR